ncbi:MAG: glutaredoxin family protein [Myxococcota bacterium]
MGRSIRAAVLGLLASCLSLGCGPGGGDGSSAESRPGLLSAAFASPGDGAAGSNETVVYYKYVDESGSIRFVQKLEEVPKPKREGSRIEWKQEPRRSASSSGSGESRLERLRRNITARLVSDEPAARTSGRGPQAEVVVYTTSWCGWCRKALAHLDRNGIAYDNRDIERDRQANDELRRKTGSTGVPVLDIDGELVIGFDPSRIDQLLGL